MLNLSLVWWCMMSGLGFIFPFFSLFLSENAGLRGSQLGLVLAVMPLMGLLGQPLWGQLADRSGQRARVLTLLALGASVGYASLGFAQTFGQFVVCTALLALFATSLSPMCVAVSLSMLTGDAATKFGRVRVLGTVGYAVVVGSFPFLLHRVAQADITPRALFMAIPAASELASPEPALRIIFPLAAVMLLATALITLRLPALGVTHHKAHPGEWRTLLKNADFLRLLAFTFFAFLTQQGPMMLFPMLVKAQGGGLEAISRMWLLMIALEIPLVFYFGRAISRIGPRNVILIGMIATTLRWGVSGFVTDLRWVYAAQLLHGVTVWGVILGLPFYADRSVPPQLRSTAQSLLAMVGVSLGSILSNFGSGWISEWVGPKAPAQVAAISGLVLACALPWFIRHRPAPRTDDA